MICLFRFFIRQVLFHLIPGDVASAATVISRVYLCTALGGWALPCGRTSDAFYAPLFRLDYVRNGSEKGKDENQSRNYIAYHAAAPVPLLCREYSASNFCLDLRPITTMMAAISKIAISPGTNA